MNASEKVGLALVGTSIENAIKSLAAHVDAEIAALKEMMSPIRPAWDRGTALEPSLRPEMPARAPEPAAADAPAPTPVEETENAG